MSANSPQAVSCPNPVCPSPRNVQKATVIIESETVHGSYSTGRSALAENLQADMPLPPAEPLPIRSLYPGRWYAIAFGVFWLWVFLGIFAIALIPIPFVGTPPPEDDPAYAQWLQRGQIAFVIALIVVVLLGIVIALLVARRGKHPPRQELEKVAQQNARAAADYQVRKSAYDNAIGNWRDRYYYCRSCGSRFVARLPKYVGDGASTVSDVLSQHNAP
jgi:hypothetical protein